MSDNEQSSRGARPREAYPSGSFLLRVWSEGREIEGQTPETRVFMRNLKTGVEHYLGDVDQLGEEVLRQFQQPVPAPEPSSRKK